MVSLLFCFRQLQRRSVLMVKANFSRHFFCMQPILSLITCVNRLLVAGIKKVWVFFNMIPLWFLFSRGCIKLASKTTQKQEGQN